MFFTPVYVLCLSTRSEYTTPLLLSKALQSTCYAWFLPHFMYCACLQEVNTQHPLILSKAFQSTCYAWFLVLFIYCAYLQEVSTPSHIIKGTSIYLLCVVFSPVYMLCLSTRSEYTLLYFQSHFN